MTITLVIWRVLSVALVAILWLVAFHPPTAARESLLGMAGWSVLLGGLGALAVLLAVGARW